MGIRLGCRNKPLHTCSISYYCCVLRAKLRRKLRLPAYRKSYPQRARKTSEQCYAASHAARYYSSRRYSRRTDDDDRSFAVRLLNELHTERNGRPDVLHVQALGLLDQRGRHREEHELRVEVAGAVVGVAAGDACVIHLLNDGGHHVEPAHREAVVLVGLRVGAAHDTTAHLDNALENHDYC